jgi:hypothetical protein
MKKTYTIVSIQKYLDVEKSNPKLQYVTTYQRSNYWDYNYYHHHHDYFVQPEQRIYNVSIQPKKIMLTTTTTIISSTMILSPDLPNFCHDTCILHNILYITTTTSYNTNYLVYKTQSDFSLPQL